MMFDNAKYGMKHTIPLSTNFKLLKYLSVSTSANYNEVWTQNMIKYNDFDIETNSIKKDTINKIGAFRDIVLVHLWEQQFMELLISVKTKKFNQLDIHTTNYSYSNRPSFEQYYDTYIIDAEGIQLNIQDIKIAYLVLQEGIYLIIWL